MSQELFTCCLKSNLLGLGWGDGVYYVQGSWNQASAFCLHKTILLFIPHRGCLWQKASVGEKCFLVEIWTCMKSLVQLPAVRFRAEDDYWKILCQHFLCGKFCFHFHIADDWMRVRSSCLSIIGYCLCPLFSMTLTFWKRLDILSRKQGGWTRFLSYFQFSDADRRKC